MNSDQIFRQTVYFTLLVVFQIPLLHDWVLFGAAFPFPYVGFVLLLPLTLGRGWVLTTAFFIGLMVDIFSSTPGMHASATVFIAFVRLRWFGLLLDTSDQELDLTITQLGWLKITLVILPLLFLHHLFLFVVEIEGFTLFGQSILKAFWSSLFSYFIVFLAMLVMAPKKRR